jgi:hypothetical protein
VVAYMIRPKIDPCMVPPPVQSTMSFISIFVFTRLNAALRSMFGQGALLFEFRANNINDWMINQA